MQMAEQRPLDDRELEALFAAVRQSKPQPSSDLMARIIEDSRHHADAAAGNRLSSGPGFLDRILGAIGGVPAAAGLLTATAAGLAIGYFAPAPLDGLSGGYLVTAAGYSLENIMPSFFDLIGEV